MCVCVCVCVKLCVYVCACVHFVICVCVCVILLFCRLLKRIGSGQFGTVNKGLWLLPEGQEEVVAVKTVKSGTQDIERLKLLQEAAIMGQFSHQNITKLHGVVTVGDPVSVHVVLIERQMRLV